MLLPAIAAATVAPAKPVKPTHQTFAFPWPGSTQIALVGEEMVRKGSYVATSGAELATPATIGSTVLSAGYYPKTAEDTQYHYHSYRTRENRMGYGFITIGRGSLGGVAEAPTAIRISKSSGEACLMRDGGGKIACSRGLPFRQVQREELTEKDLQQKLFYAGREGRSIILRYWEDSGHFARKQRIREYRFPANFPREIEVEGARLVVLEANQTSIRYRLIENFPVEWTRERTARIGG
ncbi:MAG: hypothetical protein R3D89_06700 [Sphingomonadaceae bacterium]